MGGKSKQSQRTKNNARPSSSGRSALILDNVTFDGVIKHKAGSELPPLFPTLVTPIIDPALNSELQLCFKKLNKKDPITKSKALQELCELVTSCEVEDAVAALATWPHFYRTLTVDPDRKVREGTQKCHAALVSACGRRAAPHLRRLVPAWLTARSDHHAPAAAAAEHALASTFPDTKLPEVLAFCKEDIVSHLTDGLTGVGEAVYVTKTSDPDEAAACKARLAAGSLGALQYVARRLPAVHSEWLLTALAPLLEHALFWKIPAHSETAVRAAWYGAVGALAARLADAFAARYGQRALRVMLAARESCALGAAPLWDCLLLFMYHVQDWHKYLDKKELLYKRIFDMLENGGCGAGRRLGGALLPLLARLPPSLLTLHFLQHFFTHMIRGLLNKSVLSSKIERQSWITSLDECVRYVSTQEQDYVIEVASVVHRDWMDCVLRIDHDGPLRSSLIEYSAERMTGLVRYWLKQADRNTCGKFDQLIRNFWLNVGAVLTTQVDKSSVDSESVRKIIEGHKLMLQTFKTSFLLTPKKYSIKFNDEEPVMETETPKEVLPSEAVIDRYDHNLKEVVNKICAHYFEYASKVEISEPVFSSLLPLLRDFDSESLFLCVASQFGCDCIYNLYERVLKGWLAGDTMRSKPLVDVVFMVSAHLTEGEQDALFDSFKQFPPSVVEWSISRAVGTRSAAAGRWLRAATVASAVAALATRITCTGLPADAELLTRCLTLRDDGECAVSDSAARSAVSTLCAARDSAAPAARARVALLCALSRVAPRTHAGSIAYALYAFTLNVQSSEEGVSELQAAARAACGAAARRVPAAGRHALLRDAARAARALLLLPEHTSTERMQQICSACVSLLSADTQTDVSEAARFTATLLQTTDDYKIIEKCALRHDILLSNFNCPIENDLVSSVLEFVGDFSLEDFQGYAQECKFLAVYLKSVSVGVCEQMLSNEQMVEQMCRLVYQCAVIGSVDDAYEYWPHYKLIDETKTMLEEAVESITAECPAHTRQHVAHALTRHAAARGYYWAYARKYFQDFITKEAKDKLAKENKTNDQETGQETIESNESEVADESGHKMMESDEEIDVSEEKIKESGQITKESELVDETQNKIEGQSRVVDESAQKTTQSEVPDESGEKTTQSELADKSGKETIQSGVVHEIGQKTVQSENADVSGQKTTQSEATNESGKEMTQSEVTDEIGQSEEEADFDVDMIDDMVARDGYFHVLQANVRCGPVSHRLRARYLAMLRGVWARHAADAAACARVAADAAAGHGHCDADVIVNAYYNNNDIMLYDADIRSAPWSAISLNASVCDYLSALIARHGWTLPAHQWDYATITLCSLLTSLERSKEYADCAKVCSVCAGVAGLLVSAGQFVRGLRAECTRRRPAEHVAHLISEWRDIFGPDICHNLCSIMLYTLENYSESPSSNQISMLRALSKCCPFMEWRLLTPAHRLQYPLQRFMDAALTVLEAPAHYAYKFFAYDVLVMMQRPFVEDDAERLSQWSEESPVKPTLSLQRCGAAFTRFSDTVRPALQHIRALDDTCVLEEGSAAARTALGWLLLYGAVSRQAARAAGDLAAHYTQRVRDCNWCSEAVECALKLLPGAVLRHAAGPAAAAPPHLSALFTRAPAQRVYRASGSGVVAGAACGALRACVCGAGAHDTRGWRAAAPRRHAALLDTLVTEFISPHVIKEEFTAIQLKAPDIPDTKVSIRWASREVTAVLTLDGRPIELRLTLARSHPLTPPTVSADDGLGGNTHWLVAYLTYQSGSVLSAVRMWCGSLSEQVGRAAACLVCYCRMHAATGRLPQRACRQCRNKFHTICLRKWIKTSTKSSCPVCRSPL